MKKMPPKRKPPEKNLKKSKAAPALKSSAEPQISVEFSLAEIRGVIIFEKLLVSELNSVSVSYGSPRNRELCQVIGVLNVWSALLREAESEE